MSGFRVDTSGQVDTPRKPVQIGDRLFNFVLWTDLTPFVRGTLLAALENGISQVQDGSKYRLYTPTRVGFSDLAGPTLARFIKDGEATLTFASDVCGVAYDNEADGRWFWSARQRGEWVKEGFPPIHLQIRQDDGLIWIEGERT